MAFSRSAMVAVVVFCLGAVVSPAQAAGEDEQFLQMIGEYLGVSQQFVDLAGTKEAAVYFAVEGIIEIYEQRGEQALAVPKLIEILDKYPDNQAVRNIVHFKLRDLYKDSGRSDKALLQLEQVIRENR